MSSMTRFLSTPSARRATRRYIRRRACCRDFYPRPPRGGRHKTGELALWDDEFLSTPSARRATSIASAKPSAIAISIHALREEGDNLVRWCLHLQRNFYPRPPRGGRRRIGAAHVQHDPISIHALREEGDPAVHQAEGLLPRFLSTPSARRAT